MVLHHLPDSKGSLAPSDPATLDLPSRRLEGIPSEGNHSLTERLVWNLPSLPALGSTGLVDFPESSMPKLLKGINSKILLLSQAIANVSELHERELTQSTVALREEIAWLRARCEGSLSECRPSIDCAEAPERSSNGIKHMTPLLRPDNCKQISDESVANECMLDGLAINQKDSVGYGITGSLDLAVAQAGSKDLVVLPRLPNGTNGTSRRESPREPSPQSNKEPCQFLEPLLWPVWSEDWLRATRFFNVQAVGDMHEVRHLLTKTRFAMLHKGTESKTRSIVIHPYSLTRILWDLMGGCLILYDIVAIPLQIFDIPQMQGIFDTMLWITVLFWSVDIFRSFMVGYEQDGKVVLQMRRIIPRYLRTWFLLDATIVSIDWICLMVLNQSRGTTSRIARLSKTVKALRILRMIRLVRIVKLPQVFAQILDIVKSAYGMAATKMVLLVLASFALIHVLGCYWYFLTDSELFATDGSTWVDVVGYRDKSFGFLYMSSVHWAVSQAGFTTTNLIATNTVERAYCLLTGIAWLHLFCLFLVQHIECLQMIKHMNRERWKQEQDVRSYLQKHGAPIAVTNAVLRFVRVNFTARMKRIHESDIPIMNELPIKMQIKLHTQIFLPCLRHHEAFARFISSSFLEMATVCHTCVRERYGCSASKLFDFGEEALALLMFVAGTLHYFHVSGGQAGLAPEIPAVGDWISEAALWLQWRHRGHLMCASSVEVLSLDTFRFQAVLADARDTCASFSLMRAYAQRFADAVLQEEVDSDLWPGKSTVHTLLLGAAVDAKDDFEYAGRRSKRRPGMFAMGAWGSLPFSP